MAKTAELATATLVRYNQWFIPADAASYKLLCTIGITSTQFHEDMLGVIKLQCQKKNIALRGRKFNSVMQEFEDYIAEFWNKKHRQAEIGKSRWIFRANKTAYEGAKKRRGPLETKIRQFFERWGFDADFVFTENEGSSLKLVVDFKKRKAIPVITVADVPEENERTLTIGNHQIKLSQDRRFVYIEVLTKCGSDWKRVLFSRALHEEVSDPGLFIGALIESYSK